MYVLEMSCQPGGCRKGDYWLYESYDDIKKELLDDLGSNLYLLTWYGMSIILYHIEGDKLINKYDMHRYLRLEHNGTQFPTSDTGSNSFIFYLGRDLEDPEETEQYDNEMKTLSGDEKESFDADRYYQSEKLLDTLFNEDDGTIIENSIEYSCCTVTLDWPPLPDHSPDDSEHTLRREWTDHGYDLRLHTGHNNFE